MDDTNTTHLIRNCRFKFKCDVTWESMEKTNQDDPALVRFCNKCEKKVYLTRTQRELQIHIEFNDCVAIPEEITWRYNMTNKIIGMPF